MSSSESSVKQPLSFNMTNVCCFKLAGKTAADKINKLFTFISRKNLPGQQRLLCPKLKLKGKPQVGRDGDEVGDDCSLRCCCLVTNAVYFQIWQIIARNARLTHFFLDFEKRNPKYLPSALEKKNKRTDKRGQKLILQVTKRRRRVETHIGEIFQLF